MSIETLSFKEKNIINENKYIDEDKDEELIEIATTGLDCININHDNYKINTSLQYNVPQNSPLYCNMNIDEWMENLRKISFIYQYILDGNLYRANLLLILSIILSFLLSLFSVFKLWLNDNTFQLVSNIILLITNFTNAIISISSKYYNDDANNEKIKLYITEIDSFKNEIYNYKMSSFKISSSEFIIKFNERYKRIIMKSPSINIDEYDKILELYKNHKNIVDKL